MAPTLKAKATPVLPPELRPDDPGASVAAGAGVAEALGEAADAGATVLVEPDALGAVAVVVRVDAATGDPPAGDCPVVSELVEEPLLVEAGIEYPAWA